MNKSEDLYRLSSVGVTLRLMATMTGQDPIAQIFLDVLITIVSIADL